jgi:hypothetical protein
MDTNKHDLSKFAADLVGNMPPGTYWRTENSYHRVDSIEVTDRVRVRTTGVFEDDVPKFYNHRILDQAFDQTALLDSGLVQSDVSEWVDAWKRHEDFFNAKHLEMFDKQCLLSNITDTPFDDFDALNDEIILRTTDVLYFMYKPNSFCFCIFPLDMSKYAGKDTFVYEMCLHVEKGNDLSILNASDRTTLLTHIVRDQPIYPITKYQFNELTKLIINKP